MGRASNRKKVQRQVGPKTRVDAETQQALLQMVAGLEAMAQEMGRRTEREAAARRIWSGGAEPVPAEAPQWAENSLGDRFFGGTFIDRARNAPSLATAEIPDAAVIAPIAAAELAYGEAADAAMYQIGMDWDDDEPEFPEEDGPVFLLGGCALVDATWAAGLDSISEVLGVLLPVLADAVPGLDAHVAADALIGAFAKHYRCELPDDAELVERIGNVRGDALVNLVRAGAVKPADVLPVGLRLLSALAQLCRSDSASLLQRVA